MRIRVFMFVDLDIPTIIGEADEDTDKGKIIAGAILLPTVLKTAGGPPVIVENFHVNTIYRIPEK